MSKETRNVMLGELKVGEVFENEIGEFIVLKQDTEAGVTKVIQKGLFSTRQVFGDTADYKESKLGRYFEKKVEPIFSKVFGESLVSELVEIVTVDNQHIDTFECKVRPLSFDEAREYNELLVSEDFNDWYWTCSSWSAPERGWKYSVAVVSSGGVILLNFYYNCNGVRPFCILKSNLFVSKVEE